MKTCFKCDTLKPLDQFYRHPKMADGHLNKCIDCTKKDVVDNTEVKKQDPKWLAAERKRCRLKIAAARAAGMKEKNHNVHNLNWRRRNPQKCRAESLAASALKRGEIIKSKCCSNCGTEGIVEMHHPDYKYPLAIEWLCTKCHGLTRRKT